MSKCKYHKNEVTLKQLDVNTLYLPEMQTGDNCCWEEKQTFSTCRRCSSSGARQPCSAQISASGCLYNKYQCRMHSLRQKSVGPRPSLSGWQILEARRQSADNLSVRRLLWSRVYSWWWSSYLCVNPGNWGAIHKLVIISEAYLIIGL